MKAEERARQELARIKADEEVLINEQNKHRQVEVAQKNRERVVGVEGERVEKDRALEAINREREVELSRIGKEKQLEAEKKAIADVVRARIAVEKTVAEEEERIKDLRVKADALRKTRQDTPAFRLRGTDYEAALHAPAGSFEPVGSTALAAGDVVNVVEVDPEMARWGRVALDRMLALR